MLVLESIQRLLAGVAARNRNRDLVVQQAVQAQQEWGVDLVWIGCECGSGVCVSSYLPSQQAGLPVRHQSLLD